ncbi:MAG: ubiquinone/menaquinone biosynthesis C-methylase UbiE [Sulfurimonas sp.]|jgi:ubiquinone/menaquinone biosynthesis C-methylase UbiE|uniref:class I SAM-dependent methyltransferase n=1 Tax=Sulfurimonas sp. TaxID=2022749 RepID=UPI0039E4AE8E
MKDNPKTNHNEKIIEQFSKQALPFTKIKGHYDSVDTIMMLSRVSKNDEVLDLACGTGILSCEFAKHAKSVVGLDITSAMIEQAIKMQEENGLANIQFHIESVEKLAYKDNSFDIVVTRYSFHHFLDTQTVLNEMIRVCKPNGKIIVVDVALEDKYANAYNEMERLRDPSHTKALTFKEFHALFSNKALSNHKKSSYKVDLELESQLKASFPNKGDEDKIRKIFKSDVETNSLGMNTHLEYGEVHFSYPITIFVASKLRYNPA